jgi:uncharacterized membrane protein
MIGIARGRSPQPTAYLRRASTMVNPDPSAESSDGSHTQPETPEQTGHAAGTGGNPAGHGHNKLDDKLAELPIPLRNPAILEEQARRAADIQLRIADRITGFAGSMNFVYLHIAIFTIWMLFIESKPWPTLTLIVSLEAIFLSTFVMIGQNRQSSFQQAKADRDFREQELELKTNTQLTREIHTLTAELHRRLMGDATR